jgi:hypothetical protein
VRQATSAIVLALAGLWSPAGNVLADVAPELKIYFTVFNLQTCRPFLTAFPGTSA